MSKSGFMIPPWPATVNRLPAHPEFPFLAVDIPACGGIIPPCGAVCVPFWNAIYTKANDNMKAAVRKHDGDSVRFEGTKGAEIVLMDYGSW